MAASLGSDSRRFVDQGLQTTTSVEQHKCEEACAPYLIPFDELDEVGRVERGRWCPVAAAPPFDAAPQEEQQDLIRQGIFSRTGQVRGARGGRILVRAVRGSHAAPAAAAHERGAH